MKGKELREAIRDVIYSRQSTSAGQIREILGQSAQTTRAHLRRLVKEGQVRRQWTYTTGVESKNNGHPTGFFVYFR